MSLLHQVALTYLKNIGPALARSLIVHFGSAEAIFEAPAVKLLKVAGIGEKTVKHLDFKDALKSAEAELRFIEKNNIQALFCTDAAYPKRLKNCHDSPALLYAKGIVNLNSQRIISVVGTRNATNYGKDLCRQLVDDLMQHNVLIVSGLALVIDVAVHKEFLKVPISTIASFQKLLVNLYLIILKFLVASI